MRRSALPDPIADAGDVRLSDAELSRIVRLVYERSGITLHAGKRALVLARLQKRLRAGGFSSFRDYLAHVERDASGGEITALLDAIATNHTSFFREPQHFEFLRSTVVPLLATGNIRIWSAACSSGEEPVTIAITLLDALDARHHARIRILASDLSTRALTVASCGVYAMERVAGIPLDMLRRHFERGLGAQTGQARVAAHVRRQIVARLDREHPEQQGDEEHGKECDTSPDPRHRRAGLRALHGGVLLVSVRPATGLLMTGHREDKPGCGHPGHHGAGTRDGRWRWITPPAVVTTKTKQT